MKSFNYLIQPTLREQIAHVALSQVGIREHAPDRTEYHDWYNIHGEYKYLGQSWCAIFVCWVLAQAGVRLPTIQGKEYGVYPGAAGVEILKVWMDEQGWRVDSPEQASVGDVVFYKWSHTGILVRDWSSLGFIVVEGNTSVRDPQIFDWVWPKLRRWSEISEVFRVPDHYMPPDEELRQDIESRSLSCSGMGSAPSAERLREYLEQKYSSDGEFFLDTPKKLIRL